MLYKCYVVITIGIFAVSFTSGVQILPENVNSIRYLIGAHLSLTCVLQSSSNVSGDLKFTGKNMTSFVELRSHESGYSKLTISKDASRDDEGTYTCHYQSTVDTVDVQVFKDEKTDDQKHFVKESSYFTEGDSMKIKCPILDKLMATVTWDRSDGPLRSDVRISDIGNKLENGELALDDLRVEDKGKYTCTAAWDHGNATFTHLVRVRSRLAPLWPAIGIIAELLVLLIIIFACKDRKKKEVSEPASEPSTSGSNEKSRRKYATSST